MGYINYYKLFFDCIRININDIFIWIGNPKLPTHGVSGLPQAFFFLLGGHAFLQQKNGQYLYSSRADCFLNLPELEIVLAVLRACFMRGDVQQLGVISPTVSSVPLASLSTSPVRNEELEMLHAAAASPVKMEAMQAKLSTL